MGKKLILKNVRFSYVRVFEPQQFQGVGEFKYSVVVLIPKTDTAQLQMIRETIEAESKEFIASHPKLKGTKPEVWSNPLQDGDKSDKAGYEGMYYLNANRLERLGKPIVIDRHKRPIETKEEMYSGCWGVASLSVFGYYSSAKMAGVAVGLNGLQKVTDDDRLDGGASAGDFEDYGDQNDPLKDFD